MNTLEFRTPKIDLAAWLIAAALLKYLRTEPGNRPQQVFWIFDDPETKGRTLEFEFLSGDPTANVNKFSHAKTLLRETARQMVGGRNELR